MLKPLDGRIGKRPRKSGFRSRHAVMETAKRFARAALDRGWRVRLDESHRGTCYVELNEGRAVPGNDRANVRFGVRFSDHDGGPVRKRWIDWRVDRHRGLYPLVLLLELIP